MSLKLLLIQAATCCSCQHLQLQLLTFFFEAEETSAARLGQTLQLLSNKENLESEPRQQLLSASSRTFHCTCKRCKITAQLHCCSSFAAHFHEADIFLPACFCSESLSSKEAVEQSRHVTGCLDLVTSRVGSCTLQSFLGEKTGIFFF